MSNYFVLVSPPGLRRDADVLFDRGLDCAKELKGQTPSSEIRSSFARGVTFARVNGSGSRIAYDETSGAWLLAAGTWFLGDRYSSGAEARLLSDYLMRGPDHLAHDLEGFFVIIIGNRLRNQITILTDIIGSCHCYIRQLGTMIALSGSSLILASLSPIKLDEVGCQEFLNTGIIYEDRSAYQSIKKVGPATILHIVDGAIKERRRYWTLSSISPGSLQGPQAVEALSSAIIRAARIVGSSFTRLVCDLTGGYDSRTMVAGFLTTQRPFSTTVSGAADSRDVVISKELAAMAKLPHLWIEGNPLTYGKIKKAFHFTDGEYDLVEYASTLSVHETLSQQYDASINGSFGEVARGYWWELLFPHAGSRRRVSAEMLAKRRYAAFPYEAGLIVQSTRRDMISHFTDVIERSNVYGDELPNTLQMDHLYLELRMQRWQGRIASSTDQLWPCLSPLLFRTVLETMLQTATWQRRRSLLIRQVIFSLYREFAEFPLEHGYPALPVTWRTLPRFWPLLPHYGKKVFQKVSAKIGLSDRSAPSGGSTTLANLWKEEEVSAALRVSTMMLPTCLDINVSVLQSFLDASRQSTFPYRGQWGRLLSLEYTLTKLRQFQ